MTPQERREKILALAEFKNQLNVSSVLASAKQSAAQQENARLKPLIEAMASHIERLEAALAFALKQYTPGMTKSVLEEALTASPLDALLEGEK